MVVYLHSGTTEARGLDLTQVITQLPGVEAAHFVSQNQAVDRLQGILQDTSGAFEGIERDMLPASVEVTFSPETQFVAAAHPIVEKLQTAPDVEEVDFLQPPESSRSIFFVALTQFRWLLLATLLLVATITAIVTMRLYNRTRFRQVRAMRMLGASFPFIHGPALAEGLVLGFLASGAAITASWLVYSIFAHITVEWLLVDSLQLSFLSLPHIMFLLFVGGVIGAAANLGTYATSNA